MAELSEIVVVNITKDTKNISRAGFGTAIIVGPNVNTLGRIAYYTDAASALLNLNNTSSLEAAQVNALFSGPNSVERIALGHFESKKVATFAGTMTAGSVKATVDGTDYVENFDTDTDTTLTALADAIAAGEANVATAVAVAQVLTTTPVSGEVHQVTYDIALSTGLTTVTVVGTQVAGVVYDDELAVIKLIDNDWYGVVIGSRLNTDQDDASDFVEANKKVTVHGSADANIIGQTDAGDTTSIAALAKAKARLRTMVIYGGNAATEGNGAAVFGQLLPRDPGTYTAMFKSLSGITVDAINTTESKNALDKNANTYEEFGGQNIVREGTVGTGEYLDVTIFIDWLDARITESVFSILASAAKIPYTNDGILAIKSAVSQVLQTGLNRGGISPEAFDDAGTQISGF